jgi:hypothetical protein
VTAPAMICRRQGTEYVVVAPDYPGELVALALR